MSAGRLPAGRGRVGPRRLSRSGREPGCRRASRRGHAPQLCSAPRAAGDCGGNCQSAPRPAPPRARPLRAGRPAPGPAPGRRPRAAALLAVSSACGAQGPPSFSACRDLLGNRRPTDLASLRLRAGRPGPQELTGPCHERGPLGHGRAPLPPPSPRAPGPIPARAAPAGDGDAAARAAAQSRRPQPEPGSCGDSCLAFSGLQRAPPDPGPHSHSPPPAPKPPLPRSRVGAARRRVPRLGTLGSPQHRLTS